jgi:hypothetical protein
MLGWMTCVAIGMVAMGPIAARGDAPDREAALRAMGLRDGVMLPLVTPVITHEQPAPLVWTVDVPLGDRIVTLRLMPDNLRAPGYKAYAIRRNEAGQSETVEIQAPPAATFRGVIEGEPNSIVGASIVGGGLRAIIDDGQSHWYIQPVAEAMPEIEAVAPGEAAMHMVFAKNQMRSLTGYRCGGAIAPPGDVQPIVEATARGATTPCLRQYDLAVEADIRFFLANNSNTATTISDMESVVNAMNTIFQRDAAVLATLTASFVREVPAGTPEADYINFEPYTTNVAGTLLSQFRSEWDANRASVVRDLSHLFTGRDMDGSTIGIAYTPGVCSTVRYGVSQSRFSTIFARRVAVTTHEVGHNFNAQHCDGQSDCSIMCAALGGCTGNISRFGNTAVVAIRSRATQSCLTNASAVTPGLAPRAVNDSVPFTSAGGLVTIDVMANDFSGSCDAFTLGAFSATTSAGRTVTRLVGTPPVRDRLQVQIPAGTFLSETLTYTIQTGTLQSTATVTLSPSTGRPSESTLPRRAELDARYYAIPAGTSVLPNFGSLTPYLVTSVPNVNYPSTTGPIANSGRSDNVAAVFSGFLEVTGQGGLYRFEVESDDGSRLFIGNTLVVNNDGLHGMQTREGTANLAPGFHSIRLEYFEATGGGGVILRWDPPLSAEAVIPAGSLTRLAPCTQSDVAGANQSVGVDGGLTADDIIVFLGWFFANDLRGDVAGPNQNPAPDGVLTADDVIVFLGRYFAGC